MRRILQIFALLVLLAALLFGYTLLRYTGKAACGIVGNRVDTNAPALVLFLMNGKADERRTFSEAGQTTYTYDTVLFGCESRISYTVTLFRVSAITAEICVQPEASDALFERVCASLEEEYRHLKDFYSREEVRKDGERAREMGSNSGPTFLYLNVVQSADGVRIDVSDMR